MKNPLIGLFLLCLLAPAAGGQSMGLLMEEADLVVAARTLKTGENPRCQQFALFDMEVIRGDLLEPEIHVVCFKDLCCQHHLHDGGRSLMFLRRLEGAVDGLDTAGPVYRIFSGNLGMLGLEADQEASILDMARTCARAVESRGAERAQAMVDLLGAALEEGVDCLMNSAAFDVIATPGALALLDSYDLNMAEQRFLEAAPVSALKESLLLLLGEASPPGLIPLLEDLTRARAGAYYLDQTAALLKAKGDAGTAQRLVAGFDELEGVARVNVLYVLGRLGSGKGLAAIESVMWDYLDLHHTAIIDALAADRTQGAVQALSNIVQGSRSSATLMALAALARINSVAARAQLEYIAQAASLDEIIRNQATALLAGLLR